MSLFHAPLETTIAYVGTGLCALCHECCAEVFRADGLDQIFTCRHCSAEVALRCGDHENDTCPRCRAKRALEDKGKVDLVCAVCIGAGRAAFRHDTDAGLINWERLYNTALGDGTNAPTWLSSSDDIKAGTSLDDDTGNLYGPTEQESAERVAHQAALRARIPEAELRRLLATPVLSTWQDRQWPVCCDGFMTYLGEWSRNDFIAAAPDGDGLALFRQAAHPDEVNLWHTELFDHGGALVSACSRCKRRLVQTDFT